MRHTTWGFKYFLHLPYDIHSLILSFLHPEDIIATRKTCKAMFDATLQRDLWMKAVVQLCQENAVHPSSFPVARMSLLALEYASMGVMRWKRLVSDTGSSGKKGLLSPFREMSLRHDFLSSAELFLVPGGRFLLILNAGRLSIWDLLDIHEPTACPGDIQPIASIDCHSFTSHPAPEGSGILIITITINNVSETDLL
ncbi:hypothetical protein M413DRAFT_70465 [Hebeloma cylindrosporum]|uniref:F-box domain-containing protein n=1 Tax=Hebeloma cylindrosporum TaxID=76867 RepID=A0A0C3CF14_HEBCY|nr:hypothetical protein M413DRAFT_70465 [Hebeloma cylindrosporum h7]